MSILFDLKIIIYYKYMSWLYFSKESSVKTLDLSAVAVPASLILSSHTPSVPSVAVPSVAVPSAASLGVCFALCLPFLSFRSSLPNNLDAAVSDVVAASVSASEKVAASVNAAVKEIVSVSDSAAASVVAAASVEALQLRSTVLADTEKALEALKEPVPNVTLAQVKTTLASSEAPLKIQ